MGRPAKPSVRFKHMELKRFPFQTVRLCLTYKGKRLYYSYEHNWWYGFDLTQLNSDGTFESIPDTALKEDYVLAAEELQKQSKLAIDIATEAEKRGVWGKLTSKDLSDLFGYMSGHHICLQNKAKRGHFNENERFAERMYEWRWQQVGKTRYDR